MMLLERTKTRKGTSIKDIVKHKSHHLLGNDGQDILVFGLASAIVFLSNTTLIQGDGTFTCVVHPFTQLSIFHALLKNGVSYPLLYCLVNGKDGDIYERLIKLVEKIAAERSTTILKRPVRLMMDFELAFMTAARKCKVGATIACCFFHFVKNIKKKARPVINELKRAVGKRSAEVLFAEITKRRLVMLPLVPIDLITVELVDLIVTAWKDKHPHLHSAFNELRDYLLRTYVRPRATFNKEKWCLWPGDDNQQCGREFPRRVERLSSCPGRGEHGHVPLCR